jgi:hypothetical protein
MALYSNGRIGEQDQAYRKGLVLGLTMAEVGILIVFVLLLLLAFSELRRSVAVRTFKGKQAVDSSDVTRLKAAEAVLDSAAQELGYAPADTSEDFVRLVRVLKEAAQNPYGNDQLAEARSALDEIKSAREEMQRAAETAHKGRGAEVARLTEQQSYRIANQEGQIKIFQNRLDRFGQGKGERPCWVQPNGTIDYLYDVVLTSQGIRMREVANGTRAAERALLPAPKVDQNEVLSPSAFLVRTTSLYQRSKQENCRYFVTIYDATQSFEKPLYKDLLRTVEGHFYKRLDTGAAPF